MSRTRWFRLSALFAVLLAVFSLSAVSMAEARFGGSFGSRGTRTYQTMPSTPSAPGITQPIAKSQYPTGISNSGYGYNTPFGRGGFFNGIGGWLVGGLLFSGLFGMMFGAGFGGIGGVFSFLIQIAVIVFIVRLFLRRRTPQPAGAGYSGYSYQEPQGGYGGQASYGPTGERSRASQRAGRRDEIGIGDRDLAVFERRLTQLQDAFSREDGPALRRITTPEVFGHLSQELADNAARGLRNEVYDVKLLSGDVAEAWREGPSDYATVALHYESRDVMRERATGKLVSGEDRIVGRQEVWTFVRYNGSDWLLSAIQG